MFLKLLFINSFDFQVFFGLGTKTLRFWRKSFAGLSRLHLTCPAEIFEGTTDFQIFFTVSFIPEFRELKKDFWRKTFGRFVQNFISRVQRMFLRKYFFEKIFDFLKSFQILENNIADFCGKALYPVLKSWKWQFSCPEEPFEEEHGFLKLNFYISSFARFQAQVFWRVGNFSAGRPKLHLNFTEEVLGGKYFSKENLIF